MEKIALLSLEKHQGPYELWPRLTRLYANGEDTQKKLPGFIIEAQYKCEEGYLVITSQDCPFEESNDFLLLNHAFEIVAKNGIGVPYSSFLINNHWPISEKAIRIHYDEELFYTLNIEKALFKRGPKLVAKRFKVFATDDQALASLADLRERLTKISMP